MSSILLPIHLNSIKKATYGKEARLHIIRAIERCHLDIPQPGYYKPMVSENGVLSWVASRSDMPSVESSNLFK